jgi:cytochrome c553
MTPTTCFSLLLVLMLSGMPAIAGDEKGEALYQRCAACHGDRGQGNQALKAPALAGQQADYLYRQLQQFQSGLRGADARDVAGGLMRVQVQHLKADDLQVLATYLGTLPSASKGGAKTEASSGRTGYNYYQASCGGCHGGRAEGNPAFSAPKLAGLSADYLTRQFRNYAEGIRGSDQSDRYGRQMRMMTRSLPDDKTLEQVIAYITAQQP